jgi:hypothetical protein
LESKEIKVFIKASDKISGKDAATTMEGEAANTFPCNLRVGGFYSGGKR